MKFAYSYFNPPDLTTGGDTCGRFETLAGLGAEFRGVVRWRFPVL